MADVSKECSHTTVTNFIHGVNAQLWRSNALVAANALLVLIIVAINASGRHYRQVGVTRFLFQGATALYLPIVSYVASSIGKYNTQGLEVDCFAKLHLAMLLTWTVLVQIVGTNTSATDAVDDNDGQKLGPSTELLARTIWTSYLVFYYSRQDFILLSSTFHHGFYTRTNDFCNFLFVLCVLSLAKITLKFYAFEKARRSFALGRNSRLVTGYMEQLLRESHRASEDKLIPPLIVMGEEKQEIEETPYGYTFKRRKNNLVTIDRIWRMATDNDILLARRPWLKDLCLSFALSKLLKHQFAKCHLVVLGSTKAFDFVLNLLLNKENPNMVFRVIADEVSFVLDSYYSSLPTSNFGRLLPVLNIIVSLSIITLFLIVVTKITMLFKHPFALSQMFCSTHCMLPKDLKEDQLDHDILYFGNIFFSSLPTYSLLVAVILAEAWEIISYLCSNWFKVTLLCSYVTHVSWQQSSRMQRLLGLILKFNIKFIRNQTDQMGQISLLAHPQPKKCTFSRPFFYFSSPRSRVQQVSISSDVKASIIDALRSSNGCLSKGTAALLNNGIGNHVLWACQEQDTPHVILVWHIASSIFEARHGASTGCSADKKTAMHLSRYCVYLMASTPELLPPDEAWSRKLYKTVNEDIQRALTGGSVSVEYGSMVELLGEESRDEVVKKGARLGKQLVDLVPDEETETGWRILASFWSELILYVAPSHNFKAHKKARAHGTELVTLIWVLLTHAGIIDRPNTQAAV